MAWWNRLFPQTYLGPDRQDFLINPDDADGIEKPTTRELGGTGSQIFGGVLAAEDYNVDWRGSSKWDIIDKMRKSDGQVRASLQVMKLPLLAADWHFEPGDDSPLQKTMAEELEANIINGQTQSWQDCLRHILLYPEMGSMPFEIVWEAVDSKFRVRKLAPRMPRTVSKWLIDAHGGFGGIEQRFFTQGGQLQTVTIEPEYCLVFVNEREGSDYQGNSILRPAYKHWFYKDRYYVIDAITMEKRGLGIDVAKLNEPNVSEARRRQAETAMMTLRTHEKNFLIEPEWMTYRVEGVGRGQTRDAIPSIEHHNTMILRSMLAEFVAAQGGEISLGGSVEENSSFFLMALAAVGFNIEDTFNRYLVPRWVRYNYGPQEFYPKLKHSRLDTRDNLAYADGIAKLVGSGLVTPDAEIEKQMREVFDLPEMPEDELEDELARRLRKLGRRGTRTISTDVGFGRGVRLTSHGVRVDFGEMETGLNTARDNIVLAVNRVQARQIAKLTEVAGKIIEKKQEGALSTLSVPFQGDAAIEITKELVALFTLGRTAVRAELSSQGRSIPYDLALASEDDARIKQYLGLRSRALTGVIADRLKSAVVWESLRQIRQGISDPDRVTEVLTRLSEREIVKVAETSVSEALNLGRNSYRFADEEVEYAEYSALLDDSCCEVCDDLDGTVFEVGSADYERVNPPNPQCLGRDRCRCVFVFISKSEAGR